VLRHGLIQLTKHAGLRRRKPVLGDLRVAVTLEELECGVEEHEPPMVAISAVLCVLAAATVYLRTVVVPL
jgi:hypothetical protein